jgi:MFS family permease
MNGCGCMNRTSIILVFTFLFQITLKGSILLTSLYALHLKASPAMLGFIVAVGSLFPMLFASIAGKLADRSCTGQKLLFILLG